MAPTTDALNEAGLKIIMHAGDCRLLLNGAVNDILEDKGWEEIKEKLAEAKKEITKAHIIQTEMIQSTIMEEDVKTTLIFTHAQDTLMTINSEVLMVNSMIKLYRKLEGGR